MKKTIISFFFMLALCVTSTTVLTSADTFKDVPQDREYYEAVEMLVELGAVSKAEKFNPSNNVTRGQLSKIMAISLGLDTENVKNPNFKDVPTSHQFYPYIAALAAKGVISGYADGTFGPNKIVTRAHTAKFIVNGFDFKMSKDSVDAFHDDPMYGEERNVNFDNAYTLKFYDVTTAYEFGLSKSVTRSQIALFIQRAILAKEVEKKALRISIEEMGLGIANDSFGQSKSSMHLKTKLDELNNEVYITSAVSGEYGYKASTNVDKEINVYYHVTVDENLQVTAKKVDKLEGDLRILYGYYVIGPVSNVISYSTQQVLLNPQPAVNVDLGPKGLVEFPLDFKQIGELMKLDLNYADGTSTTSYIYTYVKDDIIRNVDVEEFEEPYAYKLNMDLDVKLLEGDATGFVVEKTTEDIGYIYDSEVEVTVLKFTKPGRYVIDLDRYNPMTIHVIGYGENGMYVNEDD